MRSFWLLLLVAFVAVSLPSSAAAQGTSAVRASGAPLASQVSVGVQKARLAPAPLPLPPRADTRQNRAMMIVGGAAMLTGAVVGGDSGTLISVGGAVVFLFGLFQYLQ
ncbi:MAG TPA: hypothetical protein VGJ96_13060 [Gemmatimonadaceae bacterium]|jgi:hypothetical protein